MTWQIAVARRAINEWRDVHQLRAAALVNDAAVAAVAAFKEHIPQYDALEAWRTPEIVAAGYLRPLLIESVCKPAATLIEDARVALTRIDPRFDALSAQPPEPVFAAIPQRLETPVRERPATRQSRVAPPAALPNVLHNVFARSVAFAEQANESGHRLANAVVTRTREIIGIHALLRDAARTEVQRHWIGPASGEGRTYLADIDAVIDTLADQARTLLIGQPE